MFVNDAEKAVIALRIADSTEIGSQPDAKFILEGTDSIGGQSCTIWRVHTQGVDAKICKTKDGVLLHSEGIDPTLTATDVKYGAQDSAYFQNPADYHKETP